MISFSRAILRDIADPNCTMSATFADDVVTIACPHPLYVKTRRQAAQVARRYATSGRTRAVFSSYGRHFALGAHGDTVVYRYRIVPA